MALTPFSFVKSLTDVISFPKPWNRTVFQKLHDETQDYINNTIKPAIDGLSSNFIAPIFLNGWQNLGGGQTLVGYYKDSAGWVHLRGSACAGTMETAMFSLPEGFKPANTIHLACVSSNDTSDIFGSIYIPSDGNVIPGVGRNTMVSLDGIRFYVG